MSTKFPRALVVCLQFGSGAAA